MSDKETYLGVRTPDSIRDEALSLWHAVEEGVVDEEAYFRYMDAVAKERDRALGRVLFILLVIFAVGLALLVGMHP